MKTIICLLSFFLLISHSVFSQQIVWEKRHQEPTPDPRVSGPHYEGLDFFRTSDGGFLIWAITGSGLTSAVLRTNSEGERLWEREFGDLDSGYSIVKYAMPVGDGIKIGSRWSPRLISTHGNYQQFMLSSSGMLIDSFLSRQYSEPGGSYVLDGSMNVCEATPEGDLMVTSTSEALGIVFRRVDPHGYQRSYTWYHRADTPSYDYRGSVLRRTLDDGFVLIGDRIGPGTFRRPFVVRVDSAGELLWERILTSDTTIHYIFTGGLALTSDSGFCVATRPYTQLANGRWKAGCVLVRLDRQGMVLWENEIVTDSDYTSLRSMEQTPDGGYVAVGETTALLGTSTSPDESRSYPVMIRTDSVGRLLWKHSWSGEDLGILNGVHRLPDGSFLIVGMTHHDLYIAKIADMPSGIVEEPQGQHRVEIFYDNQHDEIVVSNNQSLRLTRIRIYDIVGRLVRSYTPNAPVSDVRLSVADLVSGMYVVVAEGDGRLNSSVIAVP